MDYFTGSTDDKTPTMKSELQGRVRTITNAIERTEDKLREERERLTTRIAEIEKWIIEQRALRAEYLELLERLD